MTLSKCKTWLGWARFEQTPCLSQAGWIYRRAGTHTLRKHDHIARRCYRSRVSSPKRKAWSGLRLEQTPLSVTSQLFFFLRRARTHAVRKHGHVAWPRGLGTLEMVLLFHSGLFRRAVGKSQESFTAEMPTFQLLYQLVLVIMAAEPRSFYLPVFVATQPQR